MKKQYRVTEKQNVRFNGARTGFNISELSEDGNAYVHVGNYFARGYDLTNYECVRYYKSLQREQDECPVCRDEPFIECEHCA